MFFNNAHFVYKNSNINLVVAASLTFLANSLISPSTAVNWVLIWTNVFAKSTPVT
jgi:hypothetical protein